jgi:hypothetical protein
MRREALNQKVSEELSHIPRIKGCIEQNLLRAAYNMVRRHDLATNPMTPAAVSLKKALELVKRDSPDFPYRYDRKFFQM